MIHTHTTHTDTHTQKWTVNSPPVVSGALNGLGWWPNQNECIYPPTIHLAFSSSFFSFVFSLLGYFTRLLSSRQRARHHKKKNYFEWRRNGGWGARTSRICITKDSQMRIIALQPRLSLSSKDTRKYIYIFIISLEMTVLHVTVGLLRPRVLTWWVTSAMPNAKAHWTLFLFLFLAAMTEQQEKRSRMKRNKKKRGIKKIGVGDVRGQNWNPGQPALVVASSFRKFVV